VTLAIRNGEKVASRERWALCAIIVFAVLLRFVRLGHLSFAGDEETTTLAALALLEGWPPTLPGGLVYVRGLPFTALEALSITAFGVNEAALRFFPAPAFGVNEAALRFFPALLAGPRIFAAWWLARPFLGWRFAIIAAALLALSPLDLEQSRNARMYSMFATLDLLFIAAAIHTALGSRRAKAALFCGIAAVATHIVAITHVIIPFAAALGRGISLRLRMLLFSVGGVVVLAFLFFKKLSKWAYSVMQNVEGATTPKVGPLGEHAASLAAMLGDGIAVWPAVTGVVIAGLLGFRAIRLLAREPSARRSVSPRDPLARWDSARRIVAPIAGAASRSCGRDVRVGARCAFNERPEHQRSHSNCKIPTGISRTQLVRNGRLGSGTLRPCALWRLGRC